MRVMKRLAMRTAESTGAGRRGAQALIVILAAVGLATWLGLGLVAGYRLEHDIRLAHEMGRCQ